MTDAHRRANAKWNKAHSSEYERIVVMLPRNDDSIKVRAKAKADGLGVSLSDYVRSLIETDLNKEE